MLNSDKVAGNDIEENENHGSLEVKEDLLSGKKLETVLKQLKNNRATGEAT